MTQSPSFLFLSFVLLTSFYSGASASTDFVGSSVCQQCHETEYNAWLQSHHFQAMQLPLDNFVAGDFNDQTFQYGDWQTRFFKSDTEYFIETKNAEAETEVFPVRYTFGFYPLQQYLVELTDGQLQAFDIAWDARAEEEGGQRWFQLQNETINNPDDPFHWTNHAQNWNSRCSECHSTNININFDQATSQFSTTFSEHNIGCESCHGGAKNHLEVVSSKRQADNSGFELSLPTQGQWQFVENQPIAHRVTSEVFDHPSMCADCHSLRIPLTDNPESFFEDYRFTLPTPPNYFVDGQIKEEVFVYGSFLQSKMHHAGVTCIDCHEPHSNRLKIEGNGLCAQCHQPENYDTPKHHHHLSSSAGAQCVNCHMPATVYMQVDPRRDHSFSIPNPAQAQITDAPDACTTCHSENSQRWAAEVLQDWQMVLGNNQLTLALAQVMDGRTASAEAVADLLEENYYRDLQVAAAIEMTSGHLGQAQLSLLQRSLTHQSALVRRAAAASMQNYPVDVKLTPLLTLLEDEALNVRLQAVASLADSYVTLPAPLKTRFDKVANEYRNSLQVYNHAVGNQLQLAQFEVAVGNKTGARYAFESALKIEPNHLPTLINYAEFLKDNNELDKEYQLLNRAIENHAQEGIANFNYALMLVRRQQPEDAIPFLKSATELPGAIARYFYVYAVALDSVEEDRDAAIKLLEGALERWPDDASLNNLFRQYNNALN